eukprot:snap_masked-scaffold_4-processed-gene-1.20-mRNA-1 protein AED:1.00 eAED:1.00 QI:0/-1/0/0/-1/1/1/0/113
MKAVKLILSDALKNKVLYVRTPENFTTLKRFIELYITQLDLSCLESTYTYDRMLVKTPEKANYAVPLNRVCKETGRKHLELLVSSINPDELPNFANSTKIKYFALSEGADEFI